jgi:hypothetical protein
LQEGEQMMEECLAECKRLRTKSLSSDELEREVERLRDGVLKKGNAYVAALLNSFSTTN